MRKKSLYWSAENRLLQRLLEGPATTSELTVLARAHGVQRVNITSALSRELRRARSHLRLVSHQVRIASKFGAVEQRVYELERVA